MSVEPDNSLQNGEDINFFMMVSDPAIARHVCQVPGIWPFVDLEVLGKAECQHRLDTWITKHDVSHVNLIREAAPDSFLVVRVNPLNESSAQEIDEVIARGADAVMIPMFRDLKTLSEFYEMVSDRADVIPLFETASSVVELPRVVAELPLTRAHFGLNDLHLDLNLDFMFDVLSSGFLEDATRELREAEVPFGIGGIARAGEGAVPPDDLLGEHVRLGSTAAILSRRFRGTCTSVEEFMEEIDFPLEIKKLRQIYRKFQRMTNSQLSNYRYKTYQKIAGVSDQISSVTRTKGAQSSQ